MDKNEREQRPKDACFRYVSAFEDLQVNPQTQGTVFYGLRLKVQCSMVPATRQN